MSKIDYKKKLKEFYSPSAKKVVAVDIPTMNFLMVGGNGAPETTEYKEAIEALYSVSYTLKFMIKKGEIGIDYGVLPLEGLWWLMICQTLSMIISLNGYGTMMIMQPELVTKNLVQAAINQVKGKKDLPAIDKVRFEPFQEGKCAQILHIGPFSEEGPTVEKVHSFIGECGNEITGKHHEIYLTDIRRAAPENWKTVIRQPM